MSLIPLDDRRGDEETKPPECQPQRRGVGRLWGRLQSLLSQVAERLGTGGDTSDSSQPTVHALPEERDEQPPRGETLESLGQQTELVSSEEDGTLTVTDVENDDATITTDTWESVER
jgi:DNA-binding ferritin-like protein